VTQVVYPRPYFSASFYIMRFQFSAAILFATTLGVVSSATIRAQESQQAGLPAGNSTGSELVRAASALSSQAVSLNQNQWVKLTDDGSIRGSVSGLRGTERVPQAKVTVSLVQDGEFVTSVTTDSEGDFMIEKSAAGTYSLIVQGEGQIAVCGLTVLTPIDGRHLPNRIDVRTVSPASPRVIELIRSNTMTRWTVGDDVTTDPVSASRKSDGSHEVEITNGGISGTLSRSNAKVDLSSTVVYLTIEGREIARTRAASNGSYRFENVVPGTYGLVASGAEGIAAVGFCAVLGENLAAGKGNSNNKLISQVASPAPAMNVELAEPNCFVPAEVIPVETVVADNAACCPTMGGGCSGGFGGGGGGGGGMGGMGWGGLAAIGGLTALGIIAATDDDEAPVTVSPIVP